MTSRRGRESRPSKSSMRYSRTLAPIALISSTSSYPPREHNSAVWKAELSGETRKRPPSRVSLRISRTGLRRLYEFRRSLTRPGDFSADFWPCDRSVNPRLRGSTDVVFLGLRRLPALTRQGDGAAGRPRSSSVAVYTGRSWVEVSQRWECSVGWGGRGWGLGNRSF